MSKIPKINPEEYPIATAIGKTLGTIASTLGVGSAAPVAPIAKKRLPRKLKKALKKKAAVAEAKKAAPKKTVAKKAAAKKN